MPCDPLLLPLGGGPASPDETLEGVSLCICFSSSPGLTSESKPSSRDGPAPVQVHPGGGGLHLSSGGPLEPASAGLAGVGAEVEDPVGIPPMLLRGCGCPGCQGLPFGSAGCAAAPAPGRLTVTPGTPPCCASARGPPRQSSACCASLSLRWGRSDRPQRLQSHLQKRLCGGDSCGLNRGRVQCHCLKTRPLEPWLPPQAPSQPCLPAGSRVPRPGHTQGRPATQLRDCAVHNPHHRLGSPALCCRPPETPSCLLSP